MVNSKITKTGLLIAIIILLAFTPLGYLKLGIIEITLITIPVVVGAIIMGPKIGALLGFIFGLTSFIQCFGMSPFGAVLLGINPIFTFILCLIPRTLMGYLVGIISENVFKDKYWLNCLIGALLNTILFTLSLILLFGGTPFIQDLMRSLFVDNFFSFAIAFVGLNGLLEAGFTSVGGHYVITALNKKFKNI